MNDDAFSLIYRAARFCCRYAADRRQAGSYASIDTRR
jgi:hypothetical protein